MSPRTTPLVLAGLLLAISPKAGVLTPPENPQYDRHVASPTTILEAITPGTVVDDGPPSGWTHLVAKSLPRLVSGDLRSLPASAAATASLVRTVIVADVREGRLGKLGVGICLPDGDHDRVVDPDDPAEQGVETSKMARVVLSHAGKELERGRIVASTPTFALFESPAALVVGGSHRKVWLRHALLVEPGDVLRCLTWAADERTGERLTTDLREYPPSFLFDCKLDVSACRILGAVPVSWSFAMGDLPEGRHRPFPPGLDEAGDGPAIERALRRGD